MRRFFLWTAVTFTVLILLAVTIAIAVHFTVGDNMSVTIDGETIHAPALAALFGLGASLGALVAGLVLVAVLASIAIVIPVMLLVIAFVAIAALLAGLSPLLVPVLLVVGAYGLLSRRSRRRRAQFASAPTAS